MQSSLPKCNVGLKSEVRCVPNLNAPWQTLNQLDASTVRASGQSKRISLMILSRVNVDFLNESYGQWTICPSHRKEYLDAWQVNKACCHHSHVNSLIETPAGKHMITDVMAIKILINEGAVVPISGRFCDSCKESYDLKYSNASGSEASTSSKVNGKLPSLTDPFRSADYSQGSKLQPMTAAVGAQIIPVTSAHVFPAARIAPAANVTIIPIASGTPPVPQTVFLPARVVYPNSIAHQKQVGVQPQPAVVQLTEQAEPEARPKPRLKPASKTHCFARQVSSDGNDQKKPKSSRNQTTTFIRSSTPEEQPSSSFWAALNLKKKETENENGEVYESHDFQNIYPVSIQMEDTLPNEYSVLNNYRQIFCYHIQRLNGVSHRGYDRVRSSVIDAFLPPTKKIIEVPPVQSVCRLRRAGALSLRLRSMKDLKNGAITKVLGIRSKINPKKKKLLVPSKLFNLKKGRSIADDERDDEEEAFSNDSDDDPTWAPVEDPRETSPLKPLKDKKSWKILIKKKRRKSDHGPIFTKKQIRMKKRQERLENKETKKRSLADRRKFRLEKLKKREERLKSQQEALQHLDREKALNGDNQKTDDQLEYHYVCNLCQISFYRETAFKHHMSSKVEYHKELREKLQIKKDSPGQMICTECGMEFKVSVAYQIHMAVEHGTGLHPFFCQICNVNLKSESAFKSHNSKLHLERPARTYYCRVCEQLFECRLKHAEHIMTHQNWPIDEPGMQCKYCGKVFSQFQSLIFHKHLATHDEEDEEQGLPQKCTCRKCLQSLPTTPEGPETSSIIRMNSVSKEEISIEDGKLNASIISDPLRRKRRLETPSIQSKMPKLKEVESCTDEKEKNDEKQDGQTEEEEIAGPFQCAICSRKFSETISLSKHLKQFHQSNLTSNGGDSPLEQRTALSRKLVDLNKVVIVKPTEKNWQECVDRNWAAEFGYGKDKPKQLGDILEKMKQKFFTAASSDDESSGEQGEAAHENTKSKKLQGKRHRPFHDAKIPRILSQTSIRSRKRMETLLQRARDFMINETEYEASASKEESVSDFPQESSSSFRSPTLLEPKLEDVEPPQGNDPATGPTMIKALHCESDVDELVDRNIEGLLKPYDVMDEIMPEAIVPSQIVSYTKLKSTKEETPNRRSDRAQLLSDPLSETSRSVFKSKTNQKSNAQHPQLQEVKDEPVDTYCNNYSSQLPSVHQFAATVEISTLNKRQLRNRNSERVGGSFLQTSENGLSDFSNPQMQVTAEDKFAENKLAFSVNRSDDQSDSSTLDVDPSTSSAIGGDVNASTKVEGSTELSDLDCIVESTNDGLLIPLENGWVCEKSWSTRTDSFTTHFWSPDGQRHPTLGFIQAYARQQNLSLDMEIFRKAIKNNPPRRDAVANEVRGKVRKTFADMAAKLNAKK